MGTLICFVYIYSQLRCIYTTLWNSWLGSSTIGPQYVVGKGIYFLCMYSSLLSGRNGIYGTHSMGKHHHRSYQISARLRVFPVGWALQSLSDICSQSKVYWSIRRSLGKSHVGPQPVVSVDIDHKVHHCVAVKVCLACKVLLVAR